MRERPILFSAPMVRAILEGRKSQTRRVANKPVKHPDFGYRMTPNILVHEREPQHVIDRACPYGQPGDRLWVREKWQAACGDNRAARIVESPRPDFGWIEYAATCDDPPPRWRPSIHMPRWASRILLEVTAVRVERLNEISAPDCIAEGVNVHPDHYDKSDASIYSVISAYYDLWTMINGPGSWEANPWVWVVEFKRIGQ